MPVNITCNRRMNLSKINLGNLLVMLGVGWLGFSFWLPYGTAGRVFRIESRVAEVARQFTHAGKELAAKELDELDWKSTAQRDAILALVNERAGSTDPKSSRHLRIATPPEHLVDTCFLFEGKHYLYMLTSPPPKVLGRENRIDRPGKEPPKDPPTPVPPGGTPPDQRPPDDVPLPGVPTPGSAIPGVQPPLDVPLPDENKLPFETYAWPKSETAGSRAVFFVPSDDRSAFTRNLNNRYIGVDRAPEPGCGRMDIESEKQENDYRGHDDERWIYQTRETPGG